MSDRITRLKAVAKEATTLNGVDVKCIVYMITLAFIVYFFFEGKIEATEKRMTQAIEEVATDNRQATEQITIEFRLFVLRRDRQNLLRLVTRNGVEEDMLSETMAEIQPLEARQRELDRLQLERGQ